MKFIKVIMISGLVISLNIFNIISTFASENFHISKPIVNSEKEMSINSILNNTDKNYILDSLRLKDNIMSIGFSEHSDKIYVDDLNTDEKLKIYAKQWLKDNYNLELSVNICYSDGLESDENGRFNVYEEDWKMETDIKINNSLKGADLVVEKTIIHELTHLALFELNKDYNDDTETFRKECIKNGSNTNDEEVGFLQSHLGCTLQY